MASPDAQVERILDERVEAGLPRHIESFDVLRIAMLVALKCGNEPMLAGALDANIA